MRKYRIPVPPPSIKHCFFHLPPEMNPPMKSAKNEMAIIMYVSELSWMFVKRSKVAKIKLVTMAITKITASPYIIAVPICLVSMVFDSLHTIWHASAAFVQAYDANRIFRTSSLHTKQIVSI